MFKKLCNVINAFTFGLGDGGASNPDSGHGGGLVVCEVLVGFLDPVVIVIHTFVVLFKVGEVSADRLSGVLQFIHHQEFAFYGVPDGEVKVVVFQGFVPHSGSITETHF
jgi:hypothetical protein